jgi:hypothetical protein
LITPIRTTSLAMTSFSPKSPFPPHRSTPSTLRC